MKSFMKVCSIFGILSVLFFMGCMGHNNSEPDTGSVKGIVDDGTRAPVSGATISIDDLSDVTDVDGSFEINGVPNGSQTIIVEKDGKVLYTGAVNVNGDTSFNITLNDAKVRIYWTNIDYRFSSPNYRCKKMRTSIPKNRDSNTIYRCNADGKNAEDITPASGMDYPNYIALDSTNKKMYYVNQKSIYRANFDGSNSEDVTPQIKAPTPSFGFISIALDVAENKMYVADCRNSKLYSANLDGSSGKEIVPSSKETSALGAVEYPIGIAVHPKSGKLFWTNEYDRGDDEVWMCDLDGSNVQNITPNDLPSEWYGCEMMSIDEVNNKLYVVYCDYGIAVIDLRSRATKYIEAAEEGSLHNIALDVKNNKIYCIPCWENYFYTMDLDGQNYTKIEPEGIDGPEYGIALEFLE